MKLKPLFHCLGIAALMLIILGIVQTVYTPLPEYDSSAPMEERNYSFDFEGQRYTLTAEFPKSYIDAYADMPTPRTSFFFETRFITTNDPIIRSVVTQIEEHTRGMTDIQQANFTLKFAQTMTYISDSKAHGIDDYWQYPVETLYRNGGDCEDQAALYLTLVRAMGYDAMFIHSSGHCAVGVNLEGLTGNHITYLGKNYYIADPTTSRGIGLPDSDGFHPSYIKEIIGILTLLFLLLALTYQYCYPSTKETAILETK